jgi:hypothetical protein
VVAAVSPTSFQVLRQGPLNFSNYDGLAIDPAGSHIYASGVSLEDLLIIDPSSLAVIERVDYDSWEPIDIAAADGRAFLPTYGGPVLIVDGTTGAESGTIATSGSNGRIVRNQAGTVLFVATSDGIFRIDLTTTTPTITHQVGPPGPVDRILVSGNDTRLYVVSNNRLASDYRVLVRNAADLAPVNSYQAPDWIFSAAATNQFLYVAYGFDHPSVPYFRSGKVLQLDPGTLAEVKHRDFLQVPMQISVNSSDEFLMAASLQRFLRVSWLERNSS